MTLAVYTALIGPGRDELRPTPAIAGWKMPVEFFAFTDRHPAGSQVAGWQIVAPPWRHPCPRRTARYPKALPHVVLPDFEAWLWLDASMQLLPAAGDVLAGLGDDDLTCFPHAARDCAYEEHRSCAEWRLDDPAVMQPQIERYRDLGFPERAGLAETGILLRRNVPAVRGFNALWWGEIDGNSPRDQLSFNFCLWHAEAPPRVGFFAGTVYDTALARHFPHAP